jgi:hypothetical protein
LEQDGGSPEPHETESAGEDPGGSPPVEPPGTPAERPRRLLVVGGLIAAVGVIAAISSTVGGGGDLTSPPPDDGLAITLPEASTSAPGVATSAASRTVATTVPPTTASPTTAAPTTVATTVAPTTTAAPTTVTPATVAPTAPATTPGAGGPTTTAPTGGGVSIESIVPDLAASRRYLATPDQVQSLIDRLLQRGGRHDVALPGNVPTLCATVALSGPIELSGRWERDGDEIAETGIVLRTAPGFGDCIDNDGQPLDPGSYQYVATDVDGTDSAVGNFVVGAARVDQQFVNNGEEDVCAVLVAPSTTDFFEDFVFSTPMRPGSSVIIPIADVSQDVEVWGCAGADDETTPTRSDFDFDPTPGEPQPLNP